MLKQYAVNYNQNIEKIFADLCYPLENLGINRFAYLKFFDNKFFYISNDQKLLEYYIDNGLYNSCDYQSEFSTLSANKTSVVFREDESIKIVKVLHEYGWYHCLSLFKKCKDCIEVYSFGSALPGYSVKSYIANIELLERFIVYFQNKAAPLLGLYDPRKFLIRQSCSVATNNEESFDTRIKNFLSQTCLNKFTIQSLDINLTKREKTCLYLLALGRSSKVIADILSLSPRTVEIFIIAIKKKLGCAFKSDLINLAYDSGAMQYLKPEVEMQFMSKK